MNALRTNLSPADVRAVADAVILRLDTTPNNFPPRKGALLAVPVASAYSGLTERSIRHLIATRQLGVVKVGRAVRIRRTDLDLLIANGSVRPDRAGA